LSQNYLKLANFRLYDMPPSDQVLLSAILEPHLYIVLLQLDSVDGSGTLMVDLLGWGHRPEV
jgi:hypothetical protein